MANLRRLGDAVSCGEDEWLTLILVHNGHLASPAEDQLKCDVMEVHVIADRTRSGDTNMRGDDCATLAVWNEVAIVHACSPGVPGISRVSQRERTGQWGQIELRCSVAEFDGQAVRSMSHPATQKF